MAYVILENPESQTVASFPVDALDESVLGTLPKALQTSLASKPLQRRSWDIGLGAHSIALFLWIGFYDQLASRTLAIGGLGPSIFGALLGGVVSFVCLFLAPALWGHRAGRPLIIVASGAFGLKAAPILPGLLLGLGQLVVFGLSVGLSLHLILDSLVGFNFLDASVTEPVTFRGYEFESPSIIFVGLIWCYANAVVGAVVVRLVVAINRVFPIFPAVLIGVVMLCFVKTAGNFTVSGIDPMWGLPVSGGPGRAVMSMLALIGSFFAVPALGAIEWGRGSSERSDVIRGGVVGVMFAPVVIVAMVFLSIAGMIGREPLAALVAKPIEAEMLVRSGISGLTRASDLNTDREVLLEARGSAYRYETAVRVALGPKFGGVALMIFGLAGLSVSCYAASSAVDQVAWLRKRPRRIRIATYFSFLAVPLVAIRAWQHLEIGFLTLGALFAPIAAILSSEWVVHRGNWPGIRKGTNLTAIMAWVLGVVVALVPTLMSIRSAEAPWPWWLFGYGIAFAVNLIGSFLKPGEYLALAPEQ